MSLRLLEDIRNQPGSLRAIVERQLGPGLAALEAAAAALREPRRIVISGMGASLYAAMPLEYDLPECRVVAASELLHYRRSLCNASSVVLISRSGETVEILKLLPVLRQLGATVVGITNEPGSTLARESDHTIEVGSGRDEMVAIQTYTGTLLCLLLLVSAVRGGSLEAVRAEAAAAIDALEVTLRQSESDPPPDPIRPIYLLGRGPSLASAHEGALLFHETAKFPAVAMEAGGFRHGPLEVVDSQFSAIVFASHAETRDLDLHLADDLRAVAGRARVITVDRVAPLFVPLVEIVPVQFAALRLAQALGLPPGQFRYLTQVTQSETGFAARPGH